MQKLARLLALAVPLAMALAPAAQAQGVSLSQLRQSWDKPTEPFKIVDTIHYVGTEGLAVYLITTPAGHILIDTALDSGTPVIRDNIAKLGFKLSDVKILLNTHAHLDHTGGLAELKAATGAAMVSSAADKPLLEGGYYPGQENNAQLRFAPVKVDRVVATGETVTLGPVTLTAHATPGHSPGCTSFSMTVNDDGKPRPLIFFCSGTVALNRLVYNPTHATIVDDYRRTYAWARSQAFDILLAPHPEMYGGMAKKAKAAAGAPNPFVQPGEFSTYLASLEKLFDAALAKQTADGPPK